MSETCSECRFFVPKERVPKNHELLPEGFGECRRHAPHGLLMYTQHADGRLNALLYPFPPVNPEDWCGEHLPALAKARGE